MIPDTILIAIHNAIHNPKCMALKIKEELYPVLETPVNMCRYIEYDNITIMAQSPNTSSKYAIQTRNGHKITWAMGDPAWTRIEGERGKEMVIRP